MNQSFSIWIFRWTRQLLGPEKPHQTKLEPMPFTPPQEIFFSGKQTAPHDPLDMTSQTILGGKSLQHFPNKKAVALSIIKFDCSPPPFPKKIRNKGYTISWSHGVQPLINQATGSATCCAIFVAPLAFTSGRFFCGDVAPLPLERVVRRRPLAGRLPFMVDLSDFLRERTRSTWRKGYPLP